MPASQSSSLLPPNATAAERAIEAAIRGGERLPVPLRDLWNPDTVPAPLLPWLAWALSIDAWKSYWPEHIKRARVRSALAIQRRKGTSDSVRQVVAAFGGDVVLREWWEQSPPGPPHTFEMTLTIAGEGGETSTAKFVDDVIDEVERTKPARCHFSFTQGFQGISRVGVIAAARPTIYRRMQFDAI